MNIEALLCAKPSPMLVQPRADSDSRQTHLGERLHAARLMSDADSKPAHLGDLLNAARLLSHEAFTASSCHAQRLPGLQELQSLSTSASFDAGNSDSDRDATKSHTATPSQNDRARLQGSRRVECFMSKTGKAAPTCVPLFPRRKAGETESAASSRGRDPVSLGYDVLEPLFALPQNAAAKRIGISLTALKQVCRKLGIERWPYRRASKMSQNDGRSPEPFVSELNA